MTLPVPIAQKSFFQRIHLRRWFVQGLLISLPIGLTVYVVLWIGGWLNNLFEAPIRALFGVDIPGLGLLLTLMIILGVGFLASHVLTAWIFERLNAVLGRIPVLHSLYSTIHETVGLLFGGTDRGFRSAVLVRQGGDMGYLIGLITRDTLSELPRLPEECIAVFIPMSYGIGGFTCLVPRDKVVPLPDLTPQQALRFAMAGGVGGGKAIRDKLGAGTESGREAAPSPSDPNR
ncbi:DUF502 domain-containing protein [Acidithiobacillus sp.]|jgi:uncharacterized membrane protein|uniref:DUF502 domain-containing protein n=1 Tax=Acidithiobacillus sp. TaxID=1872118 RepID=UPI0025BEEC4E|nr:DUF502 domain-containing protein [Acidithiobacillus sp.]MCK9189185.1 DUF502 domain-containing protein [Acidithiobacillus sp.]MCK9359627.1 DUF502 domain-containing protein [Acidithiobacillus sp.]